MIEFVVAMAPHGKGRPRATTDSYGKTRTYTPKSTRGWESAFRLASLPYRPDALITGPVRVDIVAVIRRPKRLMRRSDPDGLIWAPVRPDADNIRKSVLDAMSDWWRDDSQVVAGDTQKVYAEKDRGPRIIVTVSAPGAPGGNHGDR